MAESLSDRKLLHECAGATERLLSSPDLHLDRLEADTIDAIDHAYRVLQKINARRQAVYCVLCGELLPGESFTNRDRRQLAAYSQRACAEKAKQSADPPRQS